jgi:serine/threonine protein kinase
MTRQIGQYRIVKELGAGGMGVVYRAIDTELGREVALKRLRSEFAVSAKVLEQFRNEAKLQGRLSHPNIAQLYSVVQTQDAFCIVMELVEGVVAKDLMPLDWRLALLVILQALDALGYAHSLGVLHRDIKPENMLIDRRGMVKVMDFGIAYAVGTQRMTREKSIRGTIEYMSPEHILNKPMDGRSDVYSLGILLFELLSGRLPFDLTNDYEILRWQLDGEAPAISDVAQAPAFFDRVIARAMRKDPAERYASCAEMAEDLRKAAGPLSVTADSLQELVASRIASSRNADFDRARCYVQVAEQIRAGDLSAAERTLQSEANRHPDEGDLRQYLAVVSRARAEIGVADGAFSSQRQMMSWLRLIAAERCGETDAYERELIASLRDCPEFATAHLLYKAWRQEVRIGE